MSTASRDVDLITRDLDGLRATVVPGGVADCLSAALEHVPDAAFAMVHDVWRAATPPEVFDAVLAALANGAPAVIPVLPLTDTVKQVDDDGRIVGTRDRDALRVMQSPLGARVDVLRAAGDAPLPAGLGVPLATVPGHPHGLRLTTPFEIATVTP